MESSRFAWFRWASLYELVSSNQEEVVFYVGEKDGTEEFRWSKLLSVTLENDIELRYNSVQGNRNLNSFVEFENLQLIMEY
ncbi:hypothetical protein M5689_020478 [Euphorbia peplus]|nr:hypothetical protein M5689_020478 [Euphorbia peplus]